MYTNVSRIGHTSLWHRDHLNTYASQLFRQHLLISFAYEHLLVPLCFESEAAGNQLLCNLIVLLEHYTDVPIVRSAGELQEPAFCDATGAMSAALANSDGLFATACFAAACCSRLHWRSIILQLMSSKSPQQGQRQHWGDFSTEPLPIANCEEDVSSLKVGQLSVIAIHVQHD